MNVGFFKNKVGRPSNDTLKKRKILILLSILIVLILVGGGLYFYKQHFNSDNIAGINKNATTTAKKAVITAKKADGSNYTSNTWATTVKLTASLKGKVPGTIKYTWYKNKKIYSACKTATCTINTSQTGSFMVKIWNARKTYTSSSISVKVDANKIDSVSIYSNYNFSVGDLGVSVTPRESASGYKYQWYINGSKISGATGTSYKAKKGGSYTVKVTTGAGATKSKIVDVCSLDLSTGITTNVWSNNDVTLKYTVTSCPIKKYEWYKDDKLYSACSGKTSCKISTNQNSTYCIKITSKNGQKFSDCEKVKIDKNSFSASLYSGNNKITDMDNRNYTTSTIKKGTKLTVKGTNTLFCSKYGNAYTYEWRYSATDPYPKPEDKISTSQTYTPTKKGYYNVSITACNYKNYHKSFTVK